MKVCRLLLFLVTSTVLKVIGESQFQHERWEDPGKSVDFSCLSQLIQKYQPSIKMSWSKDDETIDHTSPRIRLDAGGNLHISQLQESDAGTYTCQTTYWETTVTTTQFTLHVGGAKPGGSGGIFGVPVPWVASVGAALLLLIIFGGFTIATKLRSGEQSPKYTKISDEEQAIDDEEEEEAED